MNQSKQKKNLIGNIKESFSGRKFRSGAYVTLVSFIVAIIIIVANMIISKLEIQIDFSKNKLYTLTETSTDLIKNLKDDISIYYMVEPGQETAVFMEIAEQYDNLSDKITLEVKDPVLYPKFASQYVEEEIVPGDFIFVNHTKNRAKYVSSDELVVTEFNYQTYTENTTGIDVEGRFTSAIQYITNEELPILYIVEGHGEAKVSTMVTAALEKMNISTKELQTLTQKQIPEDCDILYINSPETDFNEDETKIIKDYLAAGGKAVIIADYKSEGLTNFNSILEYYGIVNHSGIVVERNSSMHHVSSPIFLIPGIVEHEVTSQVLDNRIPVVLQYASGLKSADTLRSSLKLEPLLQTSDSSYDKLNTMSTTIEKEDGDLDGPFVVGYAVTETFDNKTTKLVVYSSELTFDDNTEGYGNANLLSGTINYLSDEAQTLSIPTKSVKPEYIYLTMQQALTWTAVVLVIIPAAILIIGIVVSLKRRKK